MTAQPLCRIRCPMGDWAQVAPDRETAIKLQVRHAWDAHTRLGGGPPQYVIDRTDAELTAAGCAYEPPDGRYVP